ncbi:probable receptor-like protein kinase At1g80640 isoform X1 [Phoenix dactylifera]|uniref:Probable receptor-like protein kinase At1g80640 isoform X1 n=1 Tax=Phoenix dactylifera TaxID=42345 RepID=A0A8B7C078_PHODC|nr:probable receptor-like protein kinase At1g80640 isoform X1 [Phoenix dactylifera]
MKRPPSPLLLPCILVYSSLLFPAVTHGRGSPMLSPFISPLHSPQIQPISVPPSSLAPSPIGNNLAGMQIIVRHNHLHKELIIAIVLASVAVAAIIVSTCWACLFWRRNRQTLDSKNIQSSDGARGLTLGPILSKFNSLKMTGKKGLWAMVEYSLLESSTNKFSESNILGEGGFGCVYKACFDGGLLAAVKKLDGGGQDCEREFENELDLLGRIRHPNIVSLLGYCIHGETRLLVYDLMQNGSLETQLHGPSHGSALTWHIRMKIALDTARGLEYLHEHCNPPVIHRDLKSSNILLDSEFNAKISDFGLAVTGGNHNKGSVNLSGTLGYVAPEYLLDGKLTEKSDVYAFGVVLLELLMGRKPVEKMAPSQCQSIVTWAMPQLTDRTKLPNIVDPVIRNTMDLKHLYQVAAVAVLCVQPEPSYRPLITDVLHSLVPLVPTELGGTLRIAEPSPRASHKSSSH